MKALIEKLKGVFAEHGEKIGLGAAFLLLVAVLGASGLIIPDVESLVSDLDGFRQSVAAATSKEFPPLPPPSGRPKPGDFRYAVSPFEFPVGKELNRYVDRGGSQDIGTLEWKEGHQVVHDFSEALESFQIGRITIEDRSGKPTDVVTAQWKGPVVTFSAKLLPPQSGDWDGQFTIDRKVAGTRAASGSLRVLKIREKSKLRELPQLSEVVEVDPLEIGRVRIAWKPAAVLPQPVGRTRYVVERCEGNPVTGTWVRATPSPVEALKFEDADPAIRPGKTYHYRVRAILGSDVEAGNDQVEPLPEDPDVRATVPTSPMSVEIPYTLMFRCESFPSSGAKALLTFWSWDASKREWEVHKNQMVDPSQNAEIGFSTEGKGFRGTGIRIQTIRPHDREMRVKGVAPESTYDDALKLGTVYRLVRPVVIRRSDVEPLGVKPPGTEPQPSPGTGEEAPADPGMEAAWKEEIKGIEAGVREIDSLIRKKKFDEASARVGEFMGKASTAESKMKGEAQKDARDLKKALEGKRDKIRKEQKEAEEEAKKAKEDSPLR